MLIWPEIEDYSPSMRKTTSSWFFLFGFFFLPWKKLLLVCHSFSSALLEGWTHFLKADRESWLEFPNTYVLHVTQTSYSHQGVQQYIEHQALVDVASVFCFHPSSVPCSDKNS